MDDLLADLIFSRMAGFPGGGFNPFSGGFGGGPMPGFPGGGGSPFYDDGDYGDDYGDDEYYY